MAPRANAETVAMDILAGLFLGLLLLVLCVGFGRAVQELVRRLLS